MAAHAELERTIELQRSHFLSEGRLPRDPKRSWIAS
jgi:hypothetical protein